MLAGGAILDTKNINLMNDALFKAFMAHENNRCLVIDFIHSLTGIEKEILRKATFISGEEIPIRKVTNKKQLMDFSIRLENKQRIVIEMNQSNPSHIFDKNALYAFSVIVELSHKNMDEYPKVILINIDNVNIFKTDKPVLNFKIQTNDEIVENEMYESFHLVLANIHNPKYNIDKEIIAFADFLQGKNLEKLANKYRGSEKYMAAIRTVADLTTDEDLIGYYDYEEAKEQELREAKAYALKTGHEEGRKEGRKQEKIEVAKRLLSLGTDIEIVAKSTMVPIKELEFLK